MSRDGIKASFFVPERRKHVIEVTSHSVLWGVACTGLTEGAQKGYIWTIPVI